MLPRICTAALLGLLPGLAFAGTDFGNLSAAEREAFGRELRAALLAEPEIVAKALEEPNPVRDAFRQNVEDDLAVLARLAPRLLDGHDIALFTAKDCPDCQRAVKELQDLTEALGVSFILHDLDDPEIAALAAELGLSEAPFYVLPRMILRGQMPAVVLNRYLNQ
ncbi:disulfide bond formation protein DsbA [Sulfitobacter aestuarii]|uniref:Disulfide bond formation protein DsbA n=1 Tax=Sulfitobacter aestuarii TaxID=2161676 RepID=A0ABW5U992_9RHOB